MAKKAKRAASAPKTRSRGGRAGISNRSLGDEVAEQDQLPARNTRAKATRSPGKTSRQRRAT